LTKRRFFQEQTLSSRVSAETYFPDWAIIRHVADFPEFASGFANAGLQLKC
jgi:hypothetical protein